jgi:hypothetical protein
MINFQNFVFQYDYNEYSRELSLHYALQKDIDNFDFTKYDIKKLFIGGDYIQNLTVPNGVEELICVNAGLRKLTLPNSILTLYIDNNKLVELEIPSNIERLIANNNLLQNIYVKNGCELSCLEELNLEANRLKQITFEPPDTLEVVNIWDNYILDLSDKWKKVINQNEMCYWKTPPDL